MFEHKKQLLHEVKVEKPNPQYAVLMQEQLGGGNGELKAAMQYISQSFRIKDPEIKDLFLDSGRIYRRQGGICLEIGRSVHRQAPMGSVHEENRIKNG